MGRRARDWRLYELSLRKRVKVIRTKHVLEVYEFEHVPHGRGGRTSLTSAEHERHRRTAAKRRRDYVRRLITANFGSGDLFVTLTFRDGAVSDVRNVSACYGAFRAFKERLRRRYPDVKAVAVVEFQDAHGRGAVHYHMICNLPFVPIEELERLWGNGFVWVNAIDHVDNVGAYVVKYMTKADDERLAGLKSYYRVGKLVEPEVEWVEVTPALGAPVYEAEYTSDYHGRIVYRQYNQLRDT